MINKKSVLISRSNSENKILSSKLKESNFNVITIDLIKYENLEFDIDIVSSYEYVILTSKYACRKISKYNLTNKFLVVGEESASILRETNKKSQNIIPFNSVLDIINFIKTLDSETVIYLSGSIISQDIPNIMRKIIYKTDYLVNLDLNSIMQIKITPPNYIMVFSSVNFEKLIHILKTHDIISIIKSTVFICISSNVADKVKKFFSKVLHVDKPSQGNMIKLMIEYDRRTSKACYND
jgi:uroporphyrinogen-III synthase